MIKWRLQTLSTKVLTEYSKNPRQLTRGQYAQLKASLDRFGIIDKPIVNADPEHTIIGGHQRLNVLKGTGLSDIECWVPDRELSEKEVEELNIRLNKNVGEWDFDILAESFDPGDLSEWGFEDEELKFFGLGDELNEGRDADAKIDRAAELREKWGVEDGDVWRLGDHVLVCGDCTDRGVVDKLMGGKKAKMIFTDPPWNVAIGKDSNPRHRQRAGLENDDLSKDDYMAFVSAFISSFMVACEGDVYCVLGAAEWPTLDLCMRGLGYHWSATIIWVKDIFVLGRSKYHRRYEPIWYGWHKNDKSSFCDARNLDDVWEIKRPKRSEEHPTMKPVELVERAVLNSSLVGDVVFEPFSGSGTTIVACENLNRSCRAIEISPEYVAVAIERWADLTGREPEKVE